jgi:hypothetical protein
MKKVFLFLVAAMVVLSWGIATFAMLPPSPENNDGCAVGYAHNKIVPKKLKKIDVFWGLVAEYQKRIRLANTVSGKEVSKGQALRAYLAYEELFKVYFGLPEAEKKKIFDDPRGRRLPFGINMDGTGEVKKIGALPIVSGDRRKDFEDFLQYSYSEIDYMSAWSISNRLLMIRARYYKYLAKRGLLVQPLPAS